MVPDPEARIAELEAENAALRRTPVLHCDETGVRRDGWLAWAHITSPAPADSPITPSMPSAAKRGSEAPDAVGILPDLTGVGLHDGWAGYHDFTTCRHALCNIQYLSELTYLEEEHHQAWAKDRQGSQTTAAGDAQEMGTAADQARAQGAQRLPAAQRDILLTCYRDLLAANPPPPASRRRHGQRGRLALWHSRPPATCSNSWRYGRTRRWASRPSSTT